MSFETRLRQFAERLASGMNPYQAAKGLNLNHSRSAARPDVQATVADLKAREKPRPEPVLGAQDIQELLDRAQARLAARTAPPARLKTHCDGCGVAFGEAQETFSRGVQVVCSACWARWLKTGSCPIPGREDYDVAASLARKAEETAELARREIPEAKRPLPAVDPKSDIESVTNDPPLTAEQHARGLIQQFVSGPVQIATETGSWSLEGGYKADLSAEAKAQLVAEAKQAAELRPRKAWYEQ